jgi:hypothetical protein
MIRDRRSLSEKWRRVARDSFQEEAIFAQICEALAAWRQQPGIETMLKVWMVPDWSDLSGRFRGTQLGRLRDHMVRVALSARLRRPGDE